MLESIRIFYKPGCFPGPAFFIGLARCPTHFLRQLSLLSAFLLRRAAAVHFFMQAVTAWLKILRD